MRDEGKGKESNRETCERCKADEAEPPRRFCSLCIEVIGSIQAMKFIRDNVWLASYENLEL